MHFEEINCFKFIKIPMKREYFQRCYSKISCDFHCAYCSKKENRPKNKIRELECKASLPRSWRSSALNNCLVVTYCEGREGWSCLLTPVSLAFNLYTIVPNICILQWCGKVQVLAYRLAAMYTCTGGHFIFVSADELCFVEILLLSRMVIIFNLLLQW